MDATVNTSTKQGKNAQTSPREFKIPGHLQHILCFELRDPPKAYPIVLYLKGWKPSDKEFIDTLEVRATQLVAELLFVDENQLIGTFVKATGHGEVPTIRVTRHEGLIREVIRAKGIDFGILEVAHLNEPWEAQDNAVCAFYIRVDQNIPAGECEDELKKLGERYLREKNSQFQSMVKPVHEVKAIKIIGHKKFKPNTILYVVTLPMYTRAQ